MAAESAYTSTRQIPAIIKYAWEQGIIKHGDMTLDWGGGKYDDASEYLADNGVRNLVYDPFNRSHEHNTKVLHTLNDFAVDAIFIANVLNVITDENERMELLKTINTLAVDTFVTFGNFPKIVISVYEGNKSGIAGEKTTQTNMRAKDYLPMLENIFSNFAITLKGHFFIITKEP